jgi:hypothetical protein
LVVCFHGFHFVYTWKVISDILTTRSTFARVMTLLTSQNVIDSELSLVCVIFWYILFVFHVWCWCRILLLFNEKTGRLVELILVLTTAQVPRSSIFHGPWFCQSKSLISVFFRNVITVVDNVFVLLWCHLYEV